MTSVWTIKYCTTVRVEHKGKFHFVPKKPIDMARLILVLKGKLVITLKDKTLTAKRGEIIFLPPGIQTVADYTEEENLTLVFRFLPLEGKIPKEAVLFPENDGAIQVADRFAEEIKNDPNPDGNLALSKFYKILSYLTSDAPVSKTRKKLLPTLNHIERNFTRQEKVEAWARLSFMSQTAFRKLFREEMGVSPIEYRNALRLKFAQEMISEGIPTAIAAENAGFGSLSFYLRLRKKENKKKTSQENHL